MSAEIKHPDWTWDINHDAQWRFEIFRYAEKDILAGIKFFPTITVVTVDDTCQIPMDSITRI